MLKGISVPTFFVSAMTMRNVMRYWAKLLSSHQLQRETFSGSLSIRYNRRLEDLGCAIHTSQQLEWIQIEDSRITWLHFLDEG